MIKILLKWSSVVFVLLIGALFLILGGAANPILNAQLDEISEMISVELGRDVNVGEVDLRVFPSLVFHLQDVRLGEVKGASWAVDRGTLLKTLRASKAREGSDDARLLESAHLDDFVTLDAVDIRFDTWRAMISLGRDLRVDSMSVSHLDLVLHRGASGAWNFEERSALKGSSTAEKNPEGTPHSDEGLKATSESDPQDQQRSIKQLLESLTLDNVSMKQVKVTVIDEMNLNKKTGTPQLLELIHMDMTFPELDLTRRIKVDLTAGLLSRETNLSLSADIGPFDEYLAALATSPKTSTPLQHLETSTGGESTGAAQVTESVQSEEVEEEKKSTVIERITPQIPFPIKVQFKADQVAFQALNSMLSKSSQVDISDLIVNGHAELNLSPKEGITSAGELTVNGMKLNDGDHWSPALKLKLNPHLRLNLLDDVLDLAGFRLDLNGMGIEMKGEISKLSSKMPKLERVDIKTHGIDLTRVFKLFPKARAALPRGAQVGGPVVALVRVSGDAEGQALNLSVNLNGLMLKIPNTINKPAGERLEFNLRALLSPSKIRLKELEFAVSDLKFSTRGEVSPKSGRVALTGEIPPFKINRIMRLLPSVSAAIPPKVKIDGEGALKFMVETRAKDIKLDLETSIRNANLNTPEVRLIGSGSIKAKISGDPKSQLQVRMQSALSSLDIKAGEAFEKKRGVPLDMEVEIQTSSSGVKVPRFSIQIATLRLQGAVEQRANGQFSFNTTLKPTALGPLFALSPSLKLSREIKASKAGFKLKVYGGPNINKSLTVELDDLTFKSPKTQARGQLSFSDPSAPKIRFDLSVPKLNVDALFPPPKGTSKSTNSKSVASKGSEGSKPKGGGASSPSKVDFIGTLKVNKGRARGVNFKDMKAQIHLKDDLLEVKQMSVKVFKGSVSLHPIIVRMRDGLPPKFKSTFDMTSIDLADAISQTSGSKKSLSGRLSGSLTLTGEGADYTSAVPTLNGRGDILLKRGKLHTLDIQRAILSPVSRKVPGFKMPKKGSALAFKTLKGDVTIKKGKIHLDQPITMKTPEGPLKLDGYVGLDSKISLKGALKLSPKRLGQLIGKKVASKTPLPIDLKIGGTLSKPKVSNVGAAALLGAVVIAYGAGAALRALEKNKGKIQKTLKSVEKKAKAELKSLGNKGLKKAGAKAKKSLKAKKKKLNKAKKKASKALKSLF